MKGLKITAGSSMTKAMADALPGIVGCVLLIVGYVKCFFSGFPSIVEAWGIYAIAGSFLAIILMLIYRNKYRKWILLSGFVIVLASVFAKLSDCVNGICILANDFMDYLTGRTGKIYLDFPVNGNGGQYLVATLAVVGLVLLCCWFLYRNHMSFFYMLTLISILGQITDFCYTDYGLMLIIAGLILINVHKDYRSGSIKRFFLTLSEFLFVLMLCALSVVVLGTALDIQMDFEQEVREIQFTVHKNEYDTGTDAMPEGNLKNLGKLNKSNEASLCIKAETPQKFYLRGMTGEVYTGSSWEPFDAELYRENESLFYWLHKLEFYGQASLAEAEGIMSGQKSYQTIEITNLSACKEHLYLPYALANNDILNADLIGDDRTIGEATTVEIKYLPGSVPQWYQTAIWLSQNQNQQKVIEYLKKEESYREFVYKNDLQLTNTVVGVFERLFGEEKNEERSLSEILQIVRETLDEKLTYDEDVITYNGKNDFLRYTLEQNKSGYSVHYATAATLMLRYMGVPARYVEGYFLSEEEASEYKSNEEIQITEGHAHAWTEYYMDGVGWIPFEVTPGYIDNEEWDETAMVVADGMGSGVGQSFTQSQLTYTPPKLPEQDTNLPDLNSLFRFETKQMINFLLLVVLLVILAALLWVLRRMIRLQRFRKRINRLENREAVEELFSYTFMLTQRCGIIPEANYSEIKLINEKARFSIQEITVEQRNCVEEYAKYITEYCKKQNSFWKNFKYRYILWLY